MFDSAKEGDGPEGHEARHEDRKVATLRRQASNSVAAFEGSFAPNARPTEKVSAPWWRDREYLLGGWTDTDIWKAAVSSVSVTN
jgi:hypothetical protein